MEDSVANETNIVLVHGWAGSAEAWRPVTVELETHDGFRVHAVRLPGSPGSVSQAAPTIAAATEELAAFLHGLGEPCVLIGHSMGAQVTLRAHTGEPDAVISEIVVDPAYGASDDPEAMNRWAQRIASSGHAALVEFFDEAGAGLPAQDSAGLRADLFATPIPVIVSYLRSEYIDSDAIGLMPATAIAAARRTRPVLAVCSSAAAADRERRLSNPPGSRIDVWPGYGHFLHLENPCRFSDLIASWKSGQTDTGSAAYRA